MVRGDTRADVDHQIESLWRTGTLIAASRAIEGETD
jgi:hypothetical protein